VEIAGRQRLSRHHRRAAGRQRAVLLLAVSGRQSPNTDRSARHKAAPRTSAGALRRRQNQEPAVNAARPVNRIRLPPQKGIRPRRPDPDVSLKRNRRESLRSTVCHKDGKGPWPTLLTFSCKKATDNALRLPRGGNLWNTGQTEDRMCWLRAPQRSGLHSWRWGKDGGIVGLTTWTILQQQPRVAGPRAFSGCPRLMRSRAGAVPGREAVLTNGPHAGIPQINP